MELSPALQKVISFSLVSNTESALKEFMRNGQFPSVMKTETGVKLGSLNIQLPEQQNAFTITHPFQDVLYICESVQAARVLHKCALALAAAGHTVSDIQHFAAKHAAIYSDHPHIKSTKPYSTRAANTAALIYLGFNAEDQCPDGTVEFTSQGVDQYELPIVSSYIYDSGAGHCCVNVNEGDYMAPVSNIQEMKEFSDWLDMHWSGWKK